MKDLTVRLQQKLADGTLETHEWRHVIKMVKHNDIWVFLETDDEDYLEHHVIGGTIAHLDVFANL